jgi:hypothetical protein
MNRSISHVKAKNEQQKTRRHGKFIHSAFACCVDFEQDLHAERITTAMEAMIGNMTLSGSFSFWRLE